MPDAPGDEMRVTSVPATDTPAETREDEDDFTHYFNATARLSNANRALQDDVSRLTRTLQDVSDRWKAAESALTAAEDALLAAREDTKRLDWLEAWTKGDQGFCPPGNHGGADKNWLVHREDDSRGDRHARLCDEHESATLREAIDAARAAPGTPK